MNEDHSDQSLQASGVHCPAQERQPGMPKQLQFDLALLSAESMQSKWCLQIAVVRIERDVSLGWALCAHQQDAPP